MASNERIKRFVRETLGCNCPEEVFSRIELSETRAGAKIIVGGRLLIYVTAHGDSFTGQALEDLFREGVTERDSSGLNRFRLVVAAENPETIKKTMLEQFESLSGGDAKAHLHVIDRNDPELSSIIK